MAQSRMIWVHLDTSTMTATLLRAITHPAGLSVPSQGNAQALDNGNTFVGWGDVEPSSGPLTMSGSNGSHMGLEPPN
jgi:hypothetical protein